MQSLIWGRIELVSLLKAPAIGLYHQCTTTAMKTTSRKYKNIFLRLIMLATVQLSYSAFQKCSIMIWVWWKWSYKKAETYNLNCKNKHWEAEVRARRYSKWARYPDSLAGLLKTALLVVRELSIKKFNILFFHLEGGNKYLLRKDQV